MEFMEIIKFEPALTCCAVDCDNPATVAAVSPAPPQLGEFLEFPPVGTVYLMTPICRECVSKMDETYREPAE